MSVTLITGTARTDMTAFFLRIYRITAISVWLIILILWSIPYRFMGWKGRRRIGQLLHILMKGGAKILNLRIKVYGDVNNVPNGLIVSNHMGYVDIFTHGAIFPLRFTSTTEVAKWVFFGPLIMLSHPVIVNRGSRPAAKKAFRDFAKTMRHGIYLIVYPEGTSTDGKSGILPFKSTSFDAAIEGDLPVIPIITRYIEEPGDDNVCWYGDMTFLPHAWKLLGVASIDAEVYILPPVYPEGRSRKKLAAHVHDVMEESYNNITKGEGITLYSSGKI